MKRDGELVSIWLYRHVHKELLCKLNRYCETDESDLIVYLVKYISIFCYLSIYNYNSVCACITLLL